MEELSDAEYLRDLADRVFRIPACHGTDQYDVTRLIEISRKMEKRNNGGGNEEPED